jgi:hypothetical protein
MGEHMDGHELADVVRRVVRASGSFTRIEKSDSRPFVIGGYASVMLEDEEGNELGDLEGESVSLEALQEAFTRMMKRVSRRNLNSYHTNAQIGEIIPDYTDSDGKVWKSHVVYAPTEQYPEKGLFILAELFDDVMEALKYRAAMVKNHMLAFSIGGDALQKRLVCDSEKHCVNRITFMDLFEVSACERGMNPKALSRVMKGTISHPLLDECNTGDELLHKLRR